MKRAVQVVRFFFVRSVFIGDAHIIQCRLKKQVDELVSGAIRLCGQLVQPGDGLIDNEL